MIRLVCMCGGLIGVAWAGLALTASTPRDFTCEREIDGHVYVGAVIEDARSAQTLPSGRWMIETEAGIYGYEPHPGELCRLESRN